MRNVYFTPREMAQYRARLTQRDRAMVDAAREFAMRLPFDESLLEDTAPRLTPRMPREVQ